MTRLYKLLAHFKSKSEPGTRHRVTMNTKTGFVSCSCKAFTYRGYCWHHTRVLERIVDRGYNL